MRILRPPFRLPISGVLLLSLLSITIADAQGPPPAKVVVDQLKEALLAPTSPMIGALDFDTKAGISAEISGLIQRLAVREGERVRKGDPLVYLNTDFLAKDIEILEKQVAQIEVRAQHKRKNVRRFEKLFQKNAASEQAYDDVAFQLSELLLEKEVIRKRIERQDLQVAKSMIRAPFDGLVLERHMSVGEWLDTGAPVYTIAATADMVVRVAVPETVIRHVAAGQEVSLTIEALDKALQGTVDAIVPVADVTSKTVQIKIAIPYAQGFIQNMSAIVHIPVRGEATLKMVRRDALVRHQGKIFIYTIEAQKAKLLPVTVAAYDGEMAGLSDPHLKPGMPVVVDGNERLRPNQPVEIVKAPVQDSATP
ncbi:MAG: efflux RND transporter periplasmic adaptor subunit [Desulfosarcinaceae bacterium]|nr:efflux RND transporter periplasmic adaptor subunit [Desulfosarcinaceae bacterium]